MTVQTIYGPTPESKADFRQQMHAYWEQQADLLRIDGNHELADRCAVFASTWSYGGSNTFEETCADAR